MRLASGSAAGPYEILAPVGAGGMGEVYRARDTQLHRDVAIKVLPALFARDPERLARFEREARTLAALNHSHIAQVYGVVDLPHDAGRALVLEFVDGEELAARLARSGAIATDEALRIAVQVADALETAHAQGIVHRDLKPANIKVRADGEVKVLDFGLAKALAPADAEPSALENSPTITSPFQLSQVGVVLGTAAYMAPEQAKGKPIDKRADIWAFGCVLYEMLTGDRAFAGEDVTETLAAIVRGQPDWSRLPDDTPPAIRTLLRRCLEKDLRNRLPDIGIARLEIKDASGAAARDDGRVSRPRRRVWLPWTVAAAATVVAIAALAAAVRRPVAALDGAVYKTVILPPAPLSGAPALRLALSPDGRRLAFVAPDSTGTTMLWVRPLDATVAQPLAGTANANAPFWSPDDKSIAFIADGKLRRIDAAGGAVQTICDAALAPPGSWNGNDVIVFSGIRGPLSRVTANGGPSETLRPSITEPNIALLISPWFLPDGRHFLFTGGPGASRRNTLFVGSLDSPQTTKLLHPTANAAYANGYLLHLRGTTLMAQRFDAQAMHLSGEPMPVAVDVQINPSTGTGAFSVSQNGILVYQTGASTGTRLTWLDRKGSQQSILGAQNGLRDTQLSPDGRWASATVSADATDQPDVWLFDLATGLRRRFTFSGAGSMDGVWSPDSRYLAYGAVRGNAVDLFKKTVAGGGAEELLWHDDQVKYPLGFSPNGRFLLYYVPNGAATGRVWLLPLNDGATPRPLMASLDTQAPAEVSPDSRWVAYVSDDSGRREVYVTSFPDAVGRWQISTAGGETPRWRSDGKELFFTSGDHLLSVDVMASGQEFAVSAPRVLFEVRVPAAAIGTRSTYAVMPGGERFLFNTWDREEALAPMTVIVNWPALLRR